MARTRKTAEDLVTATEFCHLFPDDQKADLLDGISYLAPPDSDRSNELTGFMYFLVNGYNSANKLGGRVFVNRFAFRLTRFRAPEPDVAYVRKGRTHLITRRRMKGSPDAAVEVVSRDSVSRDYIDKKRIYEKSGVSEYWIIDPLKQRVEFHRLKQGKYRLVPLEDGHIFRSQVISGFWLDVNWLLAEPLPNAYECLQHILGE